MEGGNTYWFRINSSAHKTESSVYSVSFSSLEV